MTDKKVKIQSLPQAGLKVKDQANTKAIDSAAYFVGVVGNLAVIPQIIRAWEGPAPGLAVLTWIFFIMIGIVWLVYAIVHQQKPLIFAQSLNIAFNLSVVIGWTIHQA